MTRAGGDAERSDEESERPSGCVTGKPSSKTWMLRMPKPFCAFEPRIEMPISRGPLPCFTSIPGLSRSTSKTEKAWVLIIRSSGTVVWTWPSGV